MTYVTTREFRANQAKYLDRVDAGERIAVRRGRKLYMLVPATEDDFVPSEELQATIAEAREEYRSGRTTHFDSKDDMHQFIDSL